MSLDVAAIHEALADQIRANVARSVTVYPFDPGAGARTFPCIVVRSGETWVEYHESMGSTGIARLELEVAAMVSARRLDAHRALADFASDAAASGSSIRNAVESDVRLGGTVQNTVLYRCRGPFPVEADDSGQTGVWELVFDVVVREARG